MGAHKIFINESFLKCFNITFMKNNIKIMKKINFFFFFHKIFLKIFHKLVPLGIHKLFPLI